MAIVHTIMTARSVNEPRTYATAMPATMPNTTSSNKIGIMTVSVAGSRDLKISSTGSRVAQLLPQSKVTTLVTNIQSCTGTGSFKPNSVRMDSICSGVA